MDERLGTETTPDDSRDSLDPRPGVRIGWVILAWAAVAIAFVAFVLPQLRETLQSSEPPSLAAQAESPVDVSSLIKLGNIAMQERASDPAAIDRALTHFTRANQLDPEHLGARFGLAWASQVKGLPEARWRSLYTQTADESSQLAFFSLYNLAYAEQKANRHPQAIAFLEHALRVKPDSADGWRKLVESRLALDQYAQAAVDIRSAIELDADSAWAFYLLGRAHAGLGEDAEAEAAWTRALQLHPGLTARIDAARADASPP